MLKMVAEKLANAKSVSEIELAMKTIVQTEWVDRMKVERQKDADQVFVGRVLGEPGQMLDRRKCATTANTENERKKPTQKLR